MTIFTIGVYGWTPERFVDALKSAGATALVDIRRRRGVRGAAHRFANASALQRLTESNGIQYIAEPRLAPPDEVRAIQKRADSQSKISKTQRDAVAPEFADAYNSAVLERYSDDDLRDLLSRAGGSPALLCVERLETACHRGLAAQWAQKLTGLPVVHLRPQ